MILLYNILLIILGFVLIISTIKIAKAALDTINEQRHANNLYRMKIEEQLSSQRDDDET